MKQFVTSLNNLLASIGTFLQSPLLLAIRLFWGIQFAATGWGKFHRIPNVIEFFRSLHIPFPAFNAYFISGLEFVGGILLIVGLFSRWWAFLLSCDMIVAYLTADREALMNFLSFVRHPIAGNPDKFVAASPFGFLIASLIIFCFGPGKLALDTIAGKIGKKSS